MSTPVERPNLPSPAAVVGVIVVAVIGLLLLKSAVGFVFTLVRFGVIVAIIAAVVWVGMKVLKGPPTDGV